MKNSLAHKQSILVSAIISASALIASPAALAQQSDDDASKLVLEEIIVTASKRVGRSPIDLATGFSSISGDSIENTSATGLHDFLQSLPSVVVDNRGDGTLVLKVRGMNSTTTGSSAVGYYIDDLAFSFLTINLAPDVSPFDLRSVEVLKGPQGTLYGAGASGGVVIVNTNDPVMDEFSGRFDVSGSQTSDSDDLNSRYSGALNFPIIDGKLAGRGVVSYVDNAGWIDDPVDGEEDMNTFERLSARLKLLAEPTDNLTLKFLASYEDTESGMIDTTLDESGNFPGAGFVDYQEGVIADATVTDATVNAILENVFFSPERLDLAGGIPFTPAKSFSDADLTQFGFVVEYEFDGWAIRNALSTLDWEGESQSLKSEGDTDAELDTLVNELRAYSTGTGDFSWVAGAYYRDAEQSLAPEASGNEDVDSEQYSVYFDGNYAIPNTKFELGFGLSYFKDETDTVYDVASLDAYIKSISALEAYNTPLEQGGFGSNPVIFAAVLAELGTDNFLNLLTSEFNQELSDVNAETSRTSPQVTVSYRPNDDLHFYARYAEGFRVETSALGFLRYLNDSNEGVLGAEDVVTYELGFKGYLFDGSLYTEFAVYRNEIEDTQQQAAVDTGLLGAIPAQISAGDSEVTGAELSLAATPFEGFEITFNTAYTDAQVDGDFYDPNLPEGPDSLIFKDGQPLNLIPEWQVNGSMSYLWGMTSNLDAQATVRWQYASERTFTKPYNNPELDPTFEGDETARVDARFEIFGDDWSVYLFGDNLLDEDGLNSEAPDIVSGPSGEANRANFDGVPGRRYQPRTFGAGLRYAF